MLFALAHLAAGASGADNLLQERIDAFRDSDIVFQRSGSNVPFMPIAFLNNSNYGEAQITDNDSGNTLSFEQRGFSAMGGLPFIPTRRDLVVTGAYLSTQRFTSDDDGVAAFRVDTIGVPLGWLRQVNERWQAAAFVMPFLHRSTQVGAKDNTQIMGGAFGRYVQHERLWWAFGVFADHSPDNSYMLPYVGASWSINERWTLSAVMPWPSLLYAPTEDWLFSLGASPSGAAWSVQGPVQAPSQSLMEERAPERFNERVAARGAGDVALNLDAWDFGLTVERRLRNSLWLSARAGIGGLRGLSYNTRDGDLQDPDIDVGASAFFALSLKVRPSALLP